MNELLAVAGVAVAVLAVVGLAACVMEVLRDALAQPEPRREWQGLTDEEIIDAREQIHAEDLCNWSFRQGVYFAEDKLKEKNT